MDLNDVCMQGKIAGLEVIWSNEEDYLYKGILKIERINGILDNIPIIISGNLLKDINLDSLVSIKGQLRSKDSIKDNRLKVDIYIYIREINNVSSLEYKNIVHLDGYIVKRPNLRTTPSGKQITDLTIACNYGKDKSAYIPTITWGKVARLSSKLKVGDYVHIEGKLQSRKYFKLIDGVSCEKTAYELSVDKIE